MLELGVPVWLFVLLEVGVPVWLLVMLEVAVPVWLPVAPTPDGETLGVLAEDGEMEGVLAEDREEEGVLAEDGEMGVLADEPVGEAEPVLEGVCTKSMQTA